MGVASRLLSETQSNEFVHETAVEYARVREAREGKSPSELLSLDEARANYYDAFHDKPAPPSQPGLHV